MKIITAFSFFAFVVYLAWPTETQSQSQQLIKPIPQTIQVGKIIEISPIEDHHFNVAANAPNKCAGKKPVKLSRDILQCKTDKVGSYQILATVCDNKDTYCKIESISLKVLAHSDAQDRDPAPL